MTTETLKSNSITALDASPPTRSTSGAFGAGRRQYVRDYVSPVNGKTTGSIYLLARIPSNARDVTVILETAGTITTLTGDVGLYYSDLASECVGRAAGLQGTAIDADFFASAMAAPAVKTPTDVTSESDNYTLALRDNELWDAAGLSADPQCPVDVAFTTTATNNLTNGALLSAQVSWTTGFLS